MYTGVYWALDRFGRPVDHMWDGYNSTFDVARVQYGYDYVGNRRTWREDVKASDNGYHYDAFYTYDGLHRLKTFDMGNLTGGPPPTGISGTPASEEDFTLDQLGNWSGYLVKAAGSTTLDQTRHHNSVNEIDTDNTDGDADASITASTGTNWADPQYDAAGNTTKMPLPASLSDIWNLRYDAWNRLVELREPSIGTLLWEFEYDGLGRRIRRRQALASTTFNFYYNEDWQVLEEQKNADSDPINQYVWHPYYIDALAVRYYDADTDNILNENNDGTHYYAQDANYNVTAIANASGSVLERYRYSPYGTVTVLDANFAVDSDGLSDIGNSVLYTGREQDPNGLQLNRHRFYASNLGRWLSRDPLGYGGSEWNLYEYSGSHPIMNVDPFGERFFGCNRKIMAIQWESLKCGLKLAGTADDATPSYPSMPFQHCVWNCRMTKDNGRRYAVETSAKKEQCDAAVCEHIIALGRECWKDLTRSQKSRFAGVCCSASQPSDWGDNQIGRDCGSFCGDEETCEDCCNAFGISENTPDGPGTNRPCGPMMRDWMTPSLPWGGLY